jgi:hypothetical protein
MVKKIKNVLLSNLKTLTKHTFCHAYFTIYMQYICTNISQIIIVVLINNTSDQVTINVNNLCMFKFYKLKFSF